jgi:hypothetical protein
MATRAMLLLFILQSVPDDIIEGECVIEFLAMVVMIWSITWEQLRGSASWRTKSGLILEWSVWRTPVEVTASHRVVTIVGVNGACWRASAEWSDAPPAIFWVQFQLADADRSARLKWRGRVSSSRAWIVVLRCSREGVCTRYPDVSCSCSSRSSLSSCGVVASVTSIRAERRKKPPPGSGGLGLRPG